MLPRLQIAIRRTEFADFPTLEYLATQVERSFLAEKNYRPPLSPDLSIFPDLAYRAPKGKAKSPVTVATVASTKKGKAKPNKPASANPCDSAKSTTTNSTVTMKPPITTAAVTATSSTVKQCCQNVGRRTSHHLTVRSTITCAGGMCVYAQRFGRFRVVEECEHICYPSSYRSS